MPASHTLMLRCSPQSGEPRSTVSFPPTLAPHRFATIRPEKGAIDVKT